VKQKAVVVPVTTDGIRLSSPIDVGLFKILADEFESSGISRIKLTDTETGERLADTEYTVSSYTGKIVINSRLKLYSIFTSILVLVYIY